MELPSHCPATAHDVGREQGNVRNDPDLVLTYMGGLFAGACSGEPTRGTVGTAGPKAGADIRRSDLLFLAAAGDKAIGRLTLPARLS